MGDKDIVSKQILKQIALDMARIILGLDVDETHIIDTDQQRIEERRADLILKIQQNGQTQLLHVEIQNDNLSTMPLRMLRYRTDIQLAYPQWPLKQYLLYIGKAPLSMASGIEEAELSYRYTTVNIQDIDYESLLRQDSPPALVIAILANFKGQPERTVIRRLLQRLDVLTAEDQAAFRNYLLMMETLAGNRRNLTQQIQEEEIMLEQVKYSELPSYKIGQEQGLELGLQHGLQQGIQQGLTQGLQLGIQQGQAKTLLRLLTKKFGPIPQHIQQHILIAQEETLSNYLDRILDANSIEEVLQAK